MIAKKRDIRLILDNIRSVHNVGSIFRTAETVGVSRIYCVGTTPVPIDRFGRKRKDFAKVSLGAEDMIAWQHVKDVDGLVEALKDEGFIIVAAEQAKDSIDYRKVKMREKMILIFGNEVSGVSRALVNASDFIAEIPLRGQKESLNVSVAAGVILHSLFC